VFISRIDVLCLGPLLEVTLTRQAMYVQCNSEGRSLNYILHVSVALVKQHAKRMRCIVSSSANCPALQYFPTLSHKRHDLRKKVTEHKMCVLIFCTTFV